MNRREVLQFLFLGGSNLFLPRLPKLGIKKIFQVGVAETPGYKSLVFADYLSFYQDAPSPLSNVGTKPATNAEFYARKRAHDEQFGFASSPVFLIIHTDGGNSVVSSVQSLEIRNVFCQFFVGKVQEEVVSIQSSYLLPDKININGTVRAGEENSYEANIQYWSSLNIEIEGHPNKIGPDLIAKVVYLAVSLMATYNIPISRLVGHHEIPNNNKPDPGKETLRIIRTQVYLTLVRMGFLELIDISEPSDVSGAFDIGNPNVPAAINDVGIARCWIDSPDWFVDWSQVLGKVPVDQYEITFIPVPFEESYLGFPAFVTWLRLPTKPLSDEKFSLYKPESMCLFVEKYIRTYYTSRLVGKSLPLTYLQIQNLATLFIEAEAFENRGDPLAEAIVSLLYVKPVNPSVKSVIQQKYFDRFSDFLT